MLATLLAAVLAQQLSCTRIRRDWQFAKAWLKQELSRP
jgi:hypothetical protein